LPIVYDEQLSMTEGLFKDLYEDSEDEDFEVDNSDDPITQSIKKQSKKVLKSLKKTDDEMEATEILCTLDDYVFTDPLDEKNEVLLLETSINMLEVRNPELFKKIKSSVNQKDLEMANTIFKKAREIAVIV